MPEQTPSESSRGADSLRLEQTELRRVLGHFATGITIVTGMYEGSPIGMTCQSFFCQSLDPPLVALSFGKSSTTFPKLREQGHFCVNVLGTTHNKLPSQFSRSGTDKWAGVEWSPSPRGNPIIKGALMWLDCAIETETSFGDHVLNVCSVTGAGTSQDQHLPIIYYRSRQHTTAALGDFGRP